MKPEDFKVGEKYRYGKSDASYECISTHMGFPVLIASYSNFDSLRATLVQSEDKLWREDRKPVECWGILFNPISYAEFSTLLRTFSSEKRRDECLNSLLPKERERVRLIHFVEKTDD